MRCAGRKLTDAYTLHWRKTDQQTNSTLTENVRTKALPRTQTGIFLHCCHSNVRPDAFVHYSTPRSVSYFLNIELLNCSAAMKALFLHSGSCSCAASLRAAN